MIEDHDPGKSSTPQVESDMSEAEIDRNLQDTFPASDPPSWTLGTDHREGTPVEEADSESDGR